MRIVQELLASCVNAWLDTHYARRYGKRLKTLKDIGSGVWVSQALKLLPSSSKLYGRRERAQRIFGQRFPRHYTSDLSIKENKK